MYKVLSLATTILTLLSRRNGIIASSVESSLVNQIDEEERTCVNSGGEEICSTTTNEHNGFDEDELDDYQDYYNDSEFDDDDDDDSFDDDNHVFEEDNEQKPGCIDTDKRCYGWAEIGECKANPNWMLHYCKKSCGTCDISDYNVGKTQKVDGDYADATKDVMSLSEEYLLNTSLSSSSFSSCGQLIRVMELSRRITVPLPRKRIKYRHRRQQ